MSINSVGGNYGNVYATYQDGNNTQAAQKYDLNNTQTDVFTTEKKSSKKGVIAGLALGAAAIATTAYALKTGKSVSKDGAKLGEVLKNGFSEIGKNIAKGVKGLLGKEKKVDVEETTKAAKKVLVFANENTAPEVKEAAEKLVNMKAPQNGQTLAKQFQEAYINKGNEILNSVASRLY